jgi:phage shock protein C
MVEETVSHYNYEEFLNGYALSGTADLDLMEREDNEPPAQLKRDNRRFVFGGILALLAGAGIFAVSNLGIFTETWPYLLGAGIAGVAAGTLQLLGRVFQKKSLDLPKLELRRKAERANQNAMNTFAQPRRGLAKSDTDRVIMGVCGGLAEHSGISPTLIRALFIFAFAVTSGVAAFFYFGIGLILPSRQR